MSVSWKIKWPKVKIHNGIMKKEEKVEMAVIVMDRLRLPPYINVLHWKCTSLSRAYRGLGLVTHYVFFCMGCRVIRF